MARHDPNGLTGSFNLNSIKKHCSFQGKIACSNALSDLYAMGVTDCDNMLMLLGVSNKMSEKERDVVVPMMMRGFKVSRKMQNIIHSSR